MTPSRSFRLNQTVSTVAFMGMGGSAVPRPVLDLPS
jgi:hypothetical protein